RARKSVIGKTRRSDGIVVWPDRPIVIGDRIVLLFERTHGANAPAGKRVVGQQNLSHSFCLGRFGNAGVETMARIRCANATRLFLPVESQSVGGEILAPEGLVELFLEQLRL